MNIPYLITSASVTVVVDGKTYVADKTHRNYESIKTMLVSDSTEFDKLVELFDITELVNRYCDGKISVKHGVVSYNDIPVDNYVTQKILQFMDEKLKSLDLHPSQFYIVNNNYLLKKYKEEFETNLNVHSIDRLSHVYSRELSSYSHPFLIDREFTFMTHIRQVKIHRYGLLMVLKKKGFLDVVDYSLLKNDIFLRDYAFNSADRTQLNPFFYAPIFSDSDLEFFKDEIKFLIEHPIKKSKHEEKIDFDRLNDFDYNMTFENGGYINSYINIVTETLFVEKENIVHITDKSYIPFYFTQIPIFLSTHHHVKSMREKYDLDFFDDLIDHSYDNEEDCQLRFLGVMKQIEKLYYQRDNMKIFFKENKNRLLRNKEIIIDIVNDNKDGRFFANLKREYNG